MALTLDCISCSFGITPEEYCDKFVDTCYTYTGTMIDNDFNDYIPETSEYPPSDYPPSDFTNMPEGSQGF
jgi:hypothetical protein